MTKLLRDLLLDLDELNREIHSVRHKEISSDTMAVRFPRASVATRRRLQALLSAPPQRWGVTASDHRAQLFEWVCNLEKAWGGVCLTPDYPGRYVPFEFECAAGHRFSMLMHGLRLGHWCQACARDRTGYSLDHACALAVKRGGQCLSDSYSNSREKLHWCCEVGHTWLACLDNATGTVRYRVHSRVRQRQDQALRQTRRHRVDGHHDDDQSVGQYGADARHDEEGSEVLRTFLHR